ncbi:MAG: choice-of-anchor tandem repeat NxxGxxAF-containing protein [Pseudomonadota bacterium]
MSRSVLEAMARDVFAGALGLAFVAQTAWGAPSVVEIVSSGDTTPSQDGVYQSFTAPKINSASTVVFNARLTDTSDDNLNDSGVYRIFLPSVGVPAIVTVQEVLREGDTYGVGGEIYGLADVFLTGVFLEDAPLPNFATGQFSNLAVRMPVTSGNAKGNTILAIEDSQLSWQLVAEAGGDVPAGDGTFREFTGATFSDISQNDGAHFGSGLNDTPEGSDDNVGIYRYLSTGELQELARKGRPSPAGTFTGVGGLRSNDVGGVALVAVDDSGDPNNDTSIFRINSFSPALIRVVGKGDAAPTDDPDAREYAAVTEYRLNNDNNVGFVGRLRDAATGFAIQDGSGLYVATAGAGGGITEIVREGQLIPDGSARFARFASSFSGDVPRSPFNNREEFAFVVGLNVENNGGQSSGLFRASAGEVVQIALEGDSYEDGTFVSFRRDPALNNQGLVVFDVELNVGMGMGDEGPFVITNQVLVLTNGEDFATVARETEQIGARTIREIFFSNNPNGPANGLNDNGAVAFSVRYEDGSDAIVVWRPELLWQAGAGSGSWDEPDNWFFNLPPNIDTIVNLDTDTDSNVTGPSADTTVNALTLGNGSGQVTLTSNGGALATLEGLTIGSNGTLAVPDDGVLLLNGSVANNGAIQVGNNGQLTFAGVVSGNGVIAGAEGSVVFQGGVEPGAN